MGKIKIIFASLIVVTILSSCNQNKSEEKMKEKLISFIEKHDSLIKPIYKEANAAYYKSSISGKQEDFDKMLELQNKITAIYSNPESFATLKEIKESNKIKDELLLRQLNVLFNEYQGSQADPKLLEEINKMQTSIEQKYSSFRVKYKGKDISDNDVENVLKTSTNSADLETVWKGHKEIGKLVSADIIALVKKRNEIAKKLGFKNYHEMSLKLSDQDPAEIDKLFDELDELTKSTFAQLKSEMDSFFSKRYNVPIAELKPWHYQNRFFQEAPKIYSVDLDKYYSKVDIVKVTKDFFAGIGLPVDDILERSDLFEKPGKNQHAYCTHIDREGDVRILCNIRPNEQWAGTMLHELGHAVYDKFIDKNLPFSLRTPAHTFTTEAVAMFFGRLSTNAQWLKENTGVSEEEASKIATDGFNQLRLQQIVFSRWSQVMYRFEKGMYENPDQDLNALWWSLVEKYQLLKKPEGRNEPDWASKIHIATSPCYYHNYHLGELLASQFSFYVAKNILKTENVNMMSLSNKPEVGSYFRDKVFSLGGKLQWNDMIEKATGEKLTAKYYAKQFVK